MVSSNNGSSSGKEKPKIVITPDMIWSWMSIVQQVIFWILFGILWGALNWLGFHFPQKFEFLRNLLTTIKSYFVLENTTPEVILGIAVALVTMTFITAGDVVIAKFEKKSPWEVLLRNADILPVNARHEYFAVAISLSAGVLEELFFRGLLFTTILLLTHSTILSIVLVSAFFASIHITVQGWRSAIWIFIVGIILNILLISRNNLITPIFAHIFINIINIHLLPPILRYLMRR
jgi:membrane protease YdiL (CAAX protease family)